MWITHSYLGTTRSGMRCLFFLLYEDYIDTQTQFAQELDLMLERFARNLGDEGALVRPFTGDIERTRSHILEKPWTEEEKRELRKTPSLLMIDVDFDDFNPREHPWMLFNFGDRMTQGIVSAYELNNIFAQLAEVVLDNNSDIFVAAHRIWYEVHPTDAVKIFELKPGIFGFSVDLMQAGRFLINLYEHLAYREQND